MIPGRLHPVRCNYQNLFHNILDIRFSGGNNHVLKMFVMGITVQTWKMRGVVIAENQLILFILAVIPVVEKNKLTFLGQHRFVNLQQIPFFRTALGSANWLSRA